MAQVINCKSKTFIDINGKLVKLDRKKTYMTKLSRVKSYDTTHDGKFLLFTIRDSFVCSRLYNYVVTINFNGADILVDVTDDPAYARRSYKI